MDPVTAWLGERVPLWQSADGLMEAGTALRGQPIYYSILGGRPVGMDDIRGLISAHAQMTASQPLVLISACPGFETSAEAEAAGIVLLAGQLRSLQQTFKQGGQPVLSIVHGVAVGGTYLMHGLSARFRAATPDTRFHDTVPDRPPVPLPKVLARGLIDAIVPPDFMSPWIHSQLNR